MWSGPPGRGGRFCPQTLQRRRKGALDDVIGKLFDRVRVNRLNQLYRQELEEANRDLRDGIAELRADQRAGRKVQLRMLPEHDQVMIGLHVDHMIKPSLYLSGDFLDYFRISEDKVLVYIADVSGHGASSAFVTVLLKNLTNRLQRNLRRGSPVKTSCTRTDSWNASTPSCWIPASVNT